MIEEMLKPYVPERFLTDDRYRTGHIRILAPAPGTRILGMHTPQMKLVAKQLAAGHDKEMILNGFSQAVSKGGPGALTHEERMIWGLIIDAEKCSLEKRLEHIRAFVPSVDNWAICDNFCCNAKWVKRADREVLWAYLTALWDRPEEFPRRIGIVMSMCYYLTPEWKDRCLRRLQESGLQEGEPYYVRMGAAWLLATALAKDPGHTRRFLQSARLPEDILKLYARKARESRITRDLPPFLSEG